MISVQAFNGLLEAGCQWEVWTFPVDMRRCCVGLGNYYVLIVQTRVKQRHRGAPTDTIGRGWLLHVLLTRYSSGMPR